MATLQEEDKSDLVIKTSTNYMTKDIDAPWYAKDIGAVLQPLSRKMLQDYAGVPPGQLEQHIESSRREAWEVAPYQSVGGLTWLNPYILLHGAHDTILRRVKEGASIIDCGCMFAPDLRQLTYEGAPTAKMYGFDIASGFFDISYKFYNDKDRFKGRLFAADIFDDSPESPLNQLDGTLDIVWAPKFIHLFDKATQVEVAARLVKLLKPQPGSLFGASQNGLPEAEEVQLPGGRTAFLGNANTAKELWSQVEERTGTRWHFESRLLDLRTIGMHKEDGSEYKRKTGYNLQWTATML